MAKTNKQTKKNNQIKTEHIQTETDWLQKMLILKEALGKNC